MDQEQYEIVFDSLEETVRSLKCLINQLTISNQLSPESSPSPELMKNLEIEGIRCLKMPNDDNHIFKIFSESLFGTDSNFKKVKFSLTNYIPKHEAEISQLLSNFYPKDFGIENYISNLMVGTYDFEITLSLL